MNWMVNFTATAFTLIVAGFALSAQQPDNTNPVLDRVGMKIQNGMVFEAEMSHQFIDAFTQDTVYTRGKVWVGENRYKVTTLQQEISVDGLVSTVYNRSQNQVIISHYYPEDDDFAPSRFLGNVQTSFQVIDEQVPEEGYISMQLEANDVFEMITKARIVIFEPELLPVEIHAEDQSGNRYETHFVDGRYITADDDIFMIHWPKDAEVIDLRDN